MIYEKRKFLFCFLFFFIASCLSTQASYEEPEYITIHNFNNNIEIRKYKPGIIAEITVTGTRQESSYKAFRILADFITGKNNSDQSKVKSNESSIKIQMTKPVIQKKYKQGRWRVAFFMPKKWTLKTLPKPQNKNIRVRQLRNRTIAVIRFSGRWASKNFDRHQKKLHDYLIKNKYKIKGSPIIAYYNSPFIPWFMRRNEIMYIISK